MLCPFLSTETNKTIKVMQKCITPDRILLNIMKWLGIQSMIMVLTCLMAIAHDDFGQILDRTISISLENVALEEAIGKIESEARIRIFYSIDHIEFRKRVSISEHSKTLKYILDQLLIPNR